MGLKPLRPNRLYLGGLQLHGGYYHPSGRGRKPASGCPGDLLLLGLHGLSNQSPFRPILRNHSCYLEKRGPDSDPARLSFLGFQPQHAKHDLRHPSGFKRHSDSNPNAYAHRNAYPYPLGNLDTGAHEYIRLDPHKYPDFNAGSNRSNNSPLSHFSAVAYLSAMAYPPARSNHSRRCSSEFWKSCGYGHSPKQRGKYDHPKFQQLHDAYSMAPELSRY